MNKTSAFLFILFLSTVLYSQNENTSKYKLKSASELLGISVVNLLDPYLSPITYSGLGLNYEHATQKLLSIDNTNLSVESKIDAMAAYTGNPENTAAMLYMGVDYSWGMYYRFKPLSKLQVLAGGNATLDFGYKYLSRNVNNPINVDLWSDINFSGKLRYDIPIRRWPIRINYEIEVPVLGCMFVPEAGASYYEIFGPGNLSNTFHLSSLHNKLGQRSKLSVDFPMKHSTWQLGLNVFELKYKANEMVFIQNRFSLQLGWKYNFFVFSGRKNVAPDNFISADK